MGTFNLSPSYLRERERGRWWISNHPDGKYARDHLMRTRGSDDLTKAFDDEYLTDWEDLQVEYKDAPIIASTNRDKREAFELAKQASSIMAPPWGGASKMRQRRNQRWGRMRVR